MPLLDHGTTVVTTAGTRQQVKNSTTKYIAFLFKAPMTNSGLVYVGDSDVSSTSSVRLVAGETYTLQLPEGRIGQIVIPAEELWVDVSVSGESVDWVFLMES